MNRYMLGFLLICTIVGLWAPTRKKLGGVIIGLAVALVLFFLLSPSKL